MGNGVVLVPHGNDGIGIVGAFAAEAPPALKLLIVGPAESPDSIRTRAAPFHRVVLALLAQDAASQAAILAMRAAFVHPGWREVEIGLNVVAYQRIGDGG